MFYTLTIAFPIVLEPSHVGIFFFSNGVLNIFSYTVSCIEGKAIKGYWTSHRPLSSAVVVLTLSPSEMTPLLVL